MGFHLLLIDQIKQDINQFCGLTGITTIEDKHCLSAIDDFEKNHDNFDQIVQLYEEVKAQRNALYLEEILKHTFREKDYETFSLPFWSYPKIYQLLPIGKREADLSHLFTVKKDFLHLPTLKRILLNRALLPLFSSVKLKKVHLVHFFTWCMPDGFGDFYAQMYSAKLVRDHFHNVRVKNITVFHEQKQIEYHQNLLPYEKFIYKNEEDLHRLHTNKHLVDALNCDLLVQFPTYYPYTPQLLSKLAIKKYEQIGEYGFLNHAPYQPKSGGLSLGLHFLEQGIFIKPYQKSDLYHFKGSNVLSIFEGKQGKDLKEHLSNIHFYLAYLRTESAHYVFFHGVLQHLMNDKKDILIVISDLSCLMRLIDQDFGKEFDHLRQYGIGKLKVVAGPVCWEKQIQEKGKTLFIHQHQEIGQEDFYKLMQLSNSPIPCRGNQSFSECLSLDKLCFIDVPDHLRYFLHDLVDIAKHTFPSYTCLHLYLLLIEKIRVAKQEVWPVLAKELKELMNQPSLSTEWKEFSRFITTYYNANDFFILLIKKDLLFLENPSLETSIEKAIDDFCHEKTTFLETVSLIKRKLEKF